MSIIQTGITVAAILAAVGAYLLSMYGTYQGQAEGKDEIDITYISVPSVLNSVIVIYLLYYLLYIRGEKHTFQFKIIGTVLLIVGLLSDIYFDFSNKSLRPTGAATGMLYSISTFNFIVRLFLIIQFQCADPFARRIKLDQPFQQPKPQQPKPQSPPAIGGKHRR
jgi:hypothetical protein